MRPPVLRMMIRACFVGFILAAFAGACLAGEIRAGAAMQVKPNSIWFQDSGLLARWQALKKSGDEKALAAYQEQALHERDAWQFINRQPVKILKVEPEKNRVEVEMTGPGRLQGTQWVLDAAAVQ